MLLEILECGLVMGRSNHAKDLLNDYLNKIMITKMPADYANIVKALIEIDQKDAAKNFVKRLWNHNKRVQEERGYDLKRVEQLTELSILTGMLKELRCYVQDINITNHQDKKKFIEKIIEKTGDETYKKIITQL